MRLGLGLGINRNSARLGVSIAAILALFTNGEQGGYYDPSSMDGQFVDNLGQTPVTAAGQQVGLKMDKRLWGGRTLAQMPESLPNSTWAGAVAGVIGAGGSLPTGWEVSASATTVAVNGLTTDSEGAPALDITIETVNGGGGSASPRFRITPSIASAVGASWRATSKIEIVSLSSNNAETPHNTVRCNVVEHDSGGSYVAETNSNDVNSVGIPTNTSSFRTLGTGPRSSFQFSVPTTVEAGKTVTLRLKISLPSFKKIPGYHRSQATAASRSILAREPVGGRRNLLVRTDDFANAAWALLNPSGTASRVGNVLNFGANALDRFTQGNVALAATDYVASIILSGTGEVRLFLIGGDGSTGAPATVALTGTPTRYFVTRAPGGSGGNGGIGIYNNVAGTPTTVTIGEPQLELGTTSTPYQKVVSTHDVTETGKRDCWFWYYDGTDDGDATRNVDFSAGDEVVIITGLRKTAQANAVLVELTASIDSNQSSFQLATLSSSDMISAASRGTGSLQRASYAVSTALTAVATMQAKISTDALSLRLDSAAVASSSGDQGSGNFANAPLYFGRRGGSTLPFSGREYLTVIRAGIPTADQIAAVERLAADRQGRTI